MKERRKDAARDFVGPLYFIALAVAVWGPALFANGYVLLSDMVFTPAMHPPVSLLAPLQGTLNVTLVYNLAWALSRATGAVLLQKAVLFLMAFLPGYLMYRNAPCRNRWARLFAGALYAVNPFIYIRMLMGQWGLVLGYALLPVALASTIKTVREPRWGRCTATALWLALIALLSIPLGAIAVLVCLLAAIFEAAVGKRPGRVAAALCVVLALALLLSAFWLLPALKGNALTGSIGKSDLEVFKTRSTSRVGTAVSVMGLYGYWKNALDPLVPRGYVPLWPAFAAGLLFLSAFGFWSCRRDKRKGPLAGALVVIGILGFLLAMGTALPVTGSVFRFLYDHLSVFRLFREPQKFAAMLALAYSMLGGLGLEHLLTRPESAGSEQARGGRRAAWVIPVILILLVCFYSFRMFGGLWNEAKAVSYPRSWSEARKMLDGDPGDWWALYLPPYWYMRFDFTGSDRTVTSPMPFYFTNRYVQLNALLVAGVQIDRQPVDGYVQAALETSRLRGNLGALLAPLNVKYVLMPLNIASTYFRFVEEQKDLQVVHRWADLVLLKNRVPVSHLTLAADKGSYTTWEALGEKAAAGNLLGSYLPRGMNTIVPQARGTPLTHSDSVTGVVDAALPSSRGRPSWALFSETYSPDWRLNGHVAARRQAGVVTAFPLEDVVGEKITIRYSNTLLVLGWSLSAAGILLCGLLLLRRRPSAETTDEQGRNTLDYN